MPKKCRLSLRNILRSTNFWRRRYWNTKVGFSAIVYLCAYSIHLLIKFSVKIIALTGDEVRDLILKGKKPDRPVVNTADGSLGDQSILKAKRSEVTPRGGLAGLADKVRPRRGAKEDN